MGTNLLHRKTKTERATQQAWDYLRSTMESAGGLADSTRSTVSTSVSSAAGTIGAATSEAKFRAHAALDALAGRRPALPWTLIAGAAVLGVAVGFAVSVAARRSLAERPAEDEIDDADEVVAIYTGDRTPVGLND
ncbi:ElaB/YqjD/DUF883 family membrane-anchored ribosome-binding protein [Catenuloplanes nepalensis]|uniref:ElaB/YqjD/DUF883 family membrane-anchored ribosome-binding protein n=1 Tax=Catenuloplanes nepalensis TaxID=587533 RepID=A0ABT9MJW4_9ACTN|nr:hypothetical protein [Catenuloplanes nepalensis]MDP9791704.1 ElaB/YqjD/DUF883 family membrane-anchored ribosome-binding protein [Catenuloplanes nepalensis]